MDLPIFKKNHQIVANGPFGVLRCGGKVANETQKMFPEINLPRFKLIINKEAEFGNFLLLKNTLSPITTTR